MPVIDLEPVYCDHLAKHPDIQTLWCPKEIGGHMNAEGNRVTAVAVRDVLQTSGQLD